MKLCTYVPVFFSFEVWVWFLVLHRPRWKPWRLQNGRSPLHKVMEHDTFSLSLIFNPSGLLIRSITIRQDQMCTYVLYHTDHVFSFTTMERLVGPILRGSTVCGVRLDGRGPWPMTSCRINCPCLGLLAPPSHNAFTLSPATPFRTWVHHGFHFTGLLRSVSFEKCRL